MDSEIIASVIIGFSALGVSWFYSYRTAKLEGDKMMKELFTEFNQRYSRLNDYLAYLEKQGWTLQELELANNKDYRNAVIDFFNLCAEEYYWYKKGRIDPKVWKAWHSGMNYWYNNVPIVKELWETEVREGGTKSYYLNGEEGFFIKKTNHALPA